MKFKNVVAPYLLALALLAGCGSQAPATPSTPETPAPTTFAATVSITFKAKSVSRDYGEGDECLMWDAGGYSDLTKGSQVVLTDNAGATVAIGSFESSVVSEVINDIPTYCTSKATFASVPLGAPSYRVVIGRRPPFDTTRADLEAGLELRISS